MTTLEIIARIQANIELTDSSDLELIDAIEKLSHSERIQVRKSFDSETPVPRNLYYDYQQQTWI